MAGIGGTSANVKFAGSHAGVSIGEDGPSQMALEDLAMMRGVPHCVVFYPCDGISAERLVAVGCRPPREWCTSGPVVRRPPVIYTPKRQLRWSGGRRCLRQHAADDVATVVAAGVTVFEALERATSALREAGHQHPRDRRLFGSACRRNPRWSPFGSADRSARSSRLRITTPLGGLGDAVSDAVAEHGITVVSSGSSVREVPRSGKPEELLDRYVASQPSHIVAAVHRQIGSPAPAPATGVRRSSVRDVVVRDLLGAA